MTQYQSQQVQAVKDIGTRKYFGSRQLKILFLDDATGSQTLKAGGYLAQRTTKISIGSCKLKMQYTVSVDFGRSRQY